MLPHERRGPGGKWLRRPGLLATKVRLRNGFLLNRPKRRAGKPIEHEQQAVLGALGHGVDFFASVSHRQKHRGTWQVLVEQVVVYDLVMPQPLSRRGVQGDKTVREEIHPMPIAAVEIGFRRLGWNENNPTLFVERLTRPWHEASGGFVGLG